MSRRAKAGRHLGSPIAEHMSAFPSLFEEGPEKRSCCVLGNGIKKWLAKEPRSGFFRQGPLPAGVPGPGLRRGLPRGSRGPVLPRAAGRCLSPGSAAHGELAKWRLREAGAARVRCTTAPPSAPAAFLPILTFETPGGRVRAGGSRREPEQLPSRGRGRGPDATSLPGLRTCPLSLLGLLWPDEQGRGGEVGCETDHL